MKKNILSQKYYDDAVSQELVNMIDKNISDLDDAVLYYEYPIIRNYDGTEITSSIMIISKNYGILLFKCDPIEKNERKKIF